MKQKLKPVATKHQDIDGNTLFRLFRMFSLFKLIPIVNFGTGPTALFLIKAIVFHYFSRPFYIMAMRFERQIAELFIKAEKFRHRKD